MHILYLKIKYEPTGLELSVRCKSDSIERWIVDLGLFIGFVDNKKSTEKHQSSLSSPVSVLT